MFTDLKRILAVPKFANQHRLSRLMNEAASVEHQQLLAECEQYVDELICEIEAVMDFIGRDMQKNLVGNIKLGAQLTLVEGTSMRVVFNSLHQRCLIKKAWEEQKGDPDETDD